MSEPQNSPENFARSICADLGKQCTGQMGYLWCWHVVVMNASGPFSMLWLHSRRISISLMGMV